MRKIELKDLLTNFTQSPWATTRDLIDMVTINLWHNKMSIALILIILFGSKYLIFRIIDNMVPDPQKPGKGHWLRNIFLRKVTNSEGKLVSRFRLWRKNSKPDTKRVYFDRRTERSAGLASLLKSMLNFCYFFFGTLMLLAQLGIVISGQTSQWLVGAFSIALALGAQNLIKDVLAGVQVLVEDQYGLGDYVDAQFGVAGVVTQIGLRTTRLKGTDGTIYYIRHSEVSKLGNRTQANANLILDIKFTWNQIPNGKVMVGTQELALAEGLLGKTIQELGSTLKAVERVAEDIPVTGKDQHVPLTKVAEVIPALAPHLGTDTLVNMKAIVDKEPETEKDLLKARNQIAEVVSKAAPTPLFKNVQMLGLVNSEANSITLRVKIELVTPGSRHQAMSVLRRQVFTNFSKYDISPQFEEVPEGLVFG